MFFGRLEPRKGLALFVDALDRLARRGRAPGRVTFLGGSSPRFDSVRHIREHAQRWPVEVRTITDFGSEEAVAYLSRPGRLAVIPSLQENASIAVTECLHAGIPFVAAATGGTPELVAPEDRARTLVAPDHIALGERIAELASAPLRAVRPRWDFERSLEGVVALACADGAVRGRGGAVCEQSGRGRHGHAPGDGVHRPSRAAGVGAHGGRQRAGAGLPGARGGAGR